MIAMIKQLRLKTLLADRTYLLSLIAVGLLVVVVVVVAMIALRPSELRVPVRYSRFDVKNYTLDQWYHLFNYLGFAVFVWLSHWLISAKLYQLKGRVFALGFVAMSAVVVLVTLVYFLAIIKIVSLTQ